MTDGPSEGKPLEKYMDLYTKLQYWYIRSEKEHGLQLDSVPSLHDFQIPKRL